MDCIKWYQLRMTQQQERAARLTCKVEGCTKSSPHAQVFFFFFFFKELPFYFLIFFKQIICTGFFCLFYLLFIYYLFIIYLLFIFGCVGSSFLCEGFLQLRRAGATLHRDARASHCCGLSCCGAQAPDAQAQQLWLTGLVAPRHVGSSQTRVPQVFFIKVSKDDFSI